MEEDRAGYRGTVWGQILADAGPRHNAGWRDAIAELTSDELAFLGSIQANRKVETRTTKSTFRLAILMFTRRAPCARAQVLAHASVRLLGIG